MSISSLNHTLISIGNDQVSSENLSNPLNTVLEKFLNIFTLGIYGSYKASSTAEMRNDILELGKSLLLWDPSRPDIPVSVSIRNKDYEINDTLHGGLRLLDRSSGKEIVFEGITLSSIRDMILFDLMSNPDFFEDMKKKVDDDSTTFQVNIVGLKQERANACGEAAMNMVLAYHGLDYNPATNSRWIYEPSYLEDIVSTLKDSGLAPALLLPKLEKAYTSAQIREGLETGPMLSVLGNHMVVVRGVNEALSRVDVFCPLLGNRVCSLADFNAHLAWDPDGGDDDSPLIQFQKSEPTTGETSVGVGKNRDPDFIPSAVDTLGVNLLRKGFSIGNSWLKSPEEFAETLS